MIILNKKIISQEDFITINERNFSFRGSEFNFTGFNAYYLHSEAAKGNKYIVDEVIEAAVKMQVKVIRLWGFYESDTLENKIAIRTEPENYNENSLEALDYVLFKAREHNIKIIFTLVNYWSDFGGVPQYINWANKFINKKFGIYEIEDFFLVEEIKQWYKNYIATILNRINTYTSIKYSDDAAILAFELMNEAEIPKESARVIWNWYNEMAKYFKSLDSNHLLTTGEIGYDYLSDKYSDISYYNDKKYLLNGYKGTSFYENSNIEKIDFASYHLYPDGWEISTEAGLNWIEDHHRIAEELGKPILLGEFGIRNSAKPETYEKWLEKIYSYKCKSAIVWQYLHEDVENKDKYGFNMNDFEIVDVMKSYSEKLDQQIQIPNQSEEIVLYQNYPNPFDIETKIKYSMTKDEYILLELYNSIGEHLKIIDEGIKRKGVHEITLSFKGTELSSGIYFYSIKIGAFKKTKKMLLIK